MYEGVNKIENKFYPVSEDNITKAQVDLGILFPKELVSLYKTIGYGFLNSTEGNFNRIMDPGSICEFRFRNGQFAHNAELDIYEEFERDKLIFFEICEGDYLSIGFTKENCGKVYDCNRMIADNLEQFLTKYQENERYFR